jgi:predicted PurR-regulated permease PerM
MLRNFLGNLSSGVIRLLVTVGILVAVYFLIVRPALDTTKQISKEANQSFEKSFKGFGNNGAGIEDVNKTLREVNKQVQRQIQQSFHVAKAHGVLDPKKLVKCIQRADGNVHKIQRCTVKF